MEVSPDLAQSKEGEALVVRWLAQEEAGIQEVFEASKPSNF